MRKPIQIKVSKNEYTAHPWWFIVVPRYLNRFSKKEDLAESIANCIIGPYFSREAAEAHRKARIYEYGERSIVWCASGYYSKDYRDLVEEIDDITPVNISVGGADA